MIVSRSRWTIRVGVALLLTMLIALGYVVFGFTYLLRPEFMPYHAEAVGMSWDHVPPAFQVLILALMRVVGGAWLALAAALGYLIFVPFRQGARWARWAVPAVGLISSGAALFATLQVQCHTPARPPVMLVAAGMIALVAGLLFSQDSAKKD